MKTLTQNTQYVRVIKQVHIGTICVGDVVVHEGKECIVGRSDIKNDSFMGVSIFGDTYCLGYKPVHKVFLEISGV